MLMPDNTVFVPVENPNMVSERTKNQRLPMADRLTTFQEVEKTYTEEEALQEASRCLGCPSRWCSKECPAGMPVPDFIRKIREKDYEGAYELIASASTLPEFCSRLCPRRSNARATVPVESVRRLWELDGWNGLWWNATMKMQIIQCRSLRGKRWL